MPSKAFKLAESIVSNPVMNDIVTNTTAVPATITTEIQSSTDQGVASVDDLPTAGNNAGDIQLVEATNRLYVWNGSGWYNIALINTSPTWDSGGQPSASYALDADSPQDATVITLAASDPEGLPISYSHVTSGSMDSMATISQDSSVFTITPKTVAQVGEGVELTGSITFRASDGVNILPYVSSFTLSFVSIIENSKYTTLLATATGTSDNNNITDSSTNNYTITVNGDAHAGTFSPYRHGGYSWDFEGGSTADDTAVGEAVVAQSSGTDFNVGTNDYSIELWIKHRTAATSGTNTNHRIFEFNDIPNGGSNNILSIRHYASGNNKNFHVIENGTNLFQSSSDPLDGEWHFIQVIRTGGTTTLYVDGSSDGSASSTTNISAISRIVVGGWYEYNYGFDGQIADFRFSNTARTAGTPTERLTSDSNTKLLVCSKPYLVDESGTATSVYLAAASGLTSRDKPTVTPLSPFDNLEYSATDHGGSVYFDGTGDYLDVTSPPSLGQNNWTFETWYYPTSSGAIYFMSQGNSDTQGATTFSYNFSTSAYNIQIYITNNYYNWVTSTVSVNNNQWHHVALTHEWNGATGGTYKVYHNGTLLDSDTHLNKFWEYSTIAGKPLGAGVYKWAGAVTNPVYFSDWRLSDSVVYSSNFTLPTSPLSSTGSTLHYKGTDASIIDKSQGSNLKLVGNTTGSTTQAKFANTKSMYFDGTGDYVGLPAGSLDLGSSDFTIEAWIYQNANSGSGNDSHVIYSDWVNINADKSVLFRVTDSTGQKIQFLYTTDGSTNNVYTSTATISNSTWTHVAVCKDSTSLRVYIDGTREVWASSPSFTLNPNSGTTVGPLIGSVYDNNLSSYRQFFDGYMQDVRITKGLARYTANFTPPTASLKG